MKYLAGTLIFVCLILLNACGGNYIPITGITDGVGTQVAQTQTASVWTPTPITPSPTTIPNEVQIINILNNNIRNTDELAELVEAEYYVARIDLIRSGNPNYFIAMRIYVVCESMLRRTCTPERGFVVLMHAFESAFKKDNQRDAISSQVPQTIQNLDVIIELAHSGQIGTFSVGWNNVKAFAGGNLSPEQLDHEIIVRPK